MGNKFLKLVWIIPAFILCSCAGRPDSLDPMQYIRYIEAPGSKLRRQVESGNTIYTLQLATPAYIASRDAAGDGWSSQDIRKRMEELKGTLFILVAMQSKDPSRVPLNSDEMALYYGGAVVRDLELQLGSQRLKPAVCHYENNLGLGPHNTLVVGFVTGDTLRSDPRFVFNDRFRQIPLIQARFEAERINNLPSLQL